MSGGLRGRLDRLTRGTGGVAGRAEQAEPGGRMVSAERTESGGRMVSERETGESPEAVAWSGLGFRWQDGPAGSCLVRERVFDAEYRHGSFAAGELAEVCAALSRLGSPDRPVDPGKLLFLDTETTGLGQGAGNVAFMVGIGWWTFEAFRIRQYVIRHPGEEAAMLGIIEDMLCSFTHLVTYNGRSFDWPLLKNRFVMHRMPPPGEPVHFDWLHPARALWRDTLPSCRLGTVEEAKLGVFRSDDVPGSMAPVLYFRYIAERNPAVLEGVVLHNETDVLTLLALSIHFGRLLGHDVSFERRRAAELVRLARWYERLGCEEEAERAYRTLASGPVHESYPYLGDAALFYKRRKNWAEAMRLWLLLVQEGKMRLMPPVEAYIELAVVYEHRLRDADEALRWTEEALRGAERRLALSRSGGERKWRDVLQSMHKRKARLLQKRRTLF